MNLAKEAKLSLLTALWFMFLTFPLMVIRVNTIKNIVEWRWMNMVYVGIGAFLLSALWRYAFTLKESGNRKQLESVYRPGVSAFESLLENKKNLAPLAGIAALLVLAFPFFFSIYQTNIMTSALIYVVLGLGLNIVVGLAGLLNLGYVAFYAVGAYTYALLNYHFGLGFWLALPIGALFSAIFGILLGFPVLRLRGDYLAIVTLGFGEIIRLVLENWSDFSFGPSGIANIPKPALFGIALGPEATVRYIYYLMIVAVIFTIFVVNRLQNSRIGRAWVALREDEIACQAMGIDKVKAKLRAFALGSMWAGMVGVIFAAKDSYICPRSFTIWESIIILSVVVLGGMGSIVGVIVGAFVLILLPEYLRELQQYRMLVFGLVLVLMMVFRPGGIVPAVRRTYRFEPGKNNPASSPETD